MTPLAQNTKSEEPRLVGCEEYYRGLHSTCGEIIAASFKADVMDNIGRSHSFVTDLEIWTDVLSRRPEVAVLRAATTEYQYSLLSLVQGQYRYSYMALRLFLELSLASVCYSAHEFNFRRWDRGEEDIHWSSLIDTENGVLSKPFIRAFCEGLSEESSQYRTLGEKVYRECSEFVHGNSHTHDKLPMSISFNDEVFNDWHKRADSVRLVVSFALCARYINFLETDQLQKLEAVITDSVGHIAVIRAFFGGVVEANS